MTGSERFLAASCGVAMLIAGCAEEDREPRVDAPASAVQRVGLAEWEILVEPRPLSPGPVELHVTNAGATPHDLVVDVGGRQVATPVLAAGERAVLRFEAPPGQVLTAWCTVTGHEAQGMVAEFPVAHAPVTHR